MRQRIFSILASLALVPLPFASMTIQAQTARKPATRTWNPVRTPWGDPDLQGTWTNTTTTPLERPDDLTGKVVLSDEELGKRDAETAARVSFDRPVGNGNPGTYNEFWMERGKLNNRT